MSQYYDVYDVMTPVCYDDYDESYEDNTDNEIDAIQLVTKFLDVLTPRQKEIMCMKYGLKNCSYPMTNREIATSLSVSLSWVWTTQEYALCRIRRKARKMGLLL